MFLTGFKPHFQKKILWYHVKNISNIVNLIFQMRVENMFNTILKILWFEYIMKFFEQHCENIYI